MLKYFQPQLTKLHFLNEGNYFLSDGNEMSISEK